MWKQRTGKAVLASSMKKRLEALGHAIFYVTLSLAGLRGAYLLLGPVIFTYVACSRRIHRLTRPYVSRRFPDHGPLRRWWDTFLIMHAFGRVLVDRAWLGRKSDAAFQGVFEDDARLQDLVGQGRGLVLLTAHVGNWQSALAQITELGVPINSLMQYEQEAVAKHFFDLSGRECPFRIIRSDGFLGGMVESTAALQRGEVVTIMGDRYAGGPAAEVDFLGSPVRFPAAAYSLAAATGAPVAVLLTAKLDRYRYGLKVWDVFYPEGGARDRRRAALQKWTARYAVCLENYVRRHPYQWYNFFDFWRQ